jgi:hypothetical protein
MTRAILSLLVFFVAIFGLAYADSRGARCELKRDIVFMTGRPALYRVCHGSITSLAGDGKFVAYLD